MPGTAIPRSLARAQGAEELFQLLELLAEPARAAGVDGFVESCLRGIEVAQDDEGRVTSFFERHRGDSPIFAAFLIRPDHARVGRHFGVLAEERHGLLRRWVLEHQTIAAPHTSVDL